MGFLDFNPFEKKVKNPQKAKRVIQNLSRENLEPLSDKKFKKLKSAGPPQYYTGNGFPESAASHSVNPGDGKIEKKIDKSVTEKSPCCCCYKPKNKRNNNTHVRGIQFQKHSKPHIDKQSQDPVRKSSHENLSKPVTQRLSQPHTDYQSQPMSKKLSDYSEPKSLPRSSSKPSQDLSNNTCCCCCPNRKRLKKNPRKVKKILRTHSKQSLVDNNLQLAPKMSNETLLKSSPHKVKQLESDSSMTSDSPKPVLFISSATTNTVTSIPKQKSVLKKEFSPQFLSKESQNIFGKKRKKVLKKEQSIIIFHGFMDEKLKRNNRNYTFNYPYVSPQGYHCGYNALKCHNTCHVNYCQPVHTCVKICC